MEMPRTPIDNLINVLSGISGGHEKALKQGIYNAVALFLLCLVCMASYGLYIILHPFVKPLIWALLCGSVLFPFKLCITNAAQSWFSETENSPEPLIVHLAMVPMRIMDKIAQTVGECFRGHLKFIGSMLAVAGVAIIIYWYTPGILIFLIWRIMQFCMSIISFFVINCNIYMITIVICGYLSVLYICWTPENAVPFNYTSCAVWLIFSLYVSNALGVYQVAVFCLLQIFCIIGFAFEVLLIMENKETQGKPLTFAEAVQVALVGEKTEVKTPEELEEEKNVFIEQVSTSRVTADDIKEPLPSTSVKVPSLKFLGRALSLDTSIAHGATSESESLSRRSTSYPNSQGFSIRERYFLRKLRTELRMSLDSPDDNVDTGKYMYGAIYACVGMLLWKHKWILMLFTLPVAWYSIKQLGKYFGLWSLIQSHGTVLGEFLKAWCQRRQQALFPAHVRGLYRIFIIIDKKLRSILKASVDSVATIAVIFALLVFTLCASIFITIQIYGEGIHLIHMTGEIINSTLVHNPDIDWVPEQWTDSVNNVLDNAYTYGRTAISGAVKNLMKDLEPTKVDVIEKKVLELWDRLYQAWMMSEESSDLIGPTVDMNAALTVWESLKESVRKVPTQMFNMSGIQSFIQENIGIFMSVMDSVWCIVKGNMSIVLSIFTELFHVILMSGTALLNFTLSTVVFFTTLFYLLSSSGKTYKPIELVAMFSPISFDRFALALQEAAIGVFTATFKLASFFGMWTWFIHNLFQVKIVYLPSAFATLLAAVPFLDAYFACIPATLELWFTRGSMTAILFFAFHFLPCNIVITDFYKEIKGGGHPYLTGLSIAGGVLYLGVEGAIFGPLLLCCIIVAINLSRGYIHSQQPISAETLDTLKSHIDRLETDE